MTLDECQAECALVFLFLRAESLRARLSFKLRTVGRRETETETEILSQSAPSSVAPRLNPD